MEDHLNLHLSVSGCGQGNLWGGVSTQILELTLGLLNSLYGCVQGRVILELTLGLLNSLYGCVQGRVILELTLGLLNSLYGCVQGRVILELTLGLLNSLYGCVWWSYAVYKVGFVSYRS